MGIAAQCLHGAGLCLVPKPENDHRPWLLRHGPLSFVSSLLVVAKVLGLGIIALTPIPAELSTITSNRIVQLTNNERVAAGLSELAVSSALTQAAVQKGQHMLDEDYFAHISPTGVTPWFWMNKVGYVYQVAGENLAIDFIEAEDVVAAWLASPTHKENMLHSSYTETGVGVVSGEFQGHTSTVVVHMFGLPAAAAAPAAPASSAAPTVKSQVTSTPLPSPTRVPSPSPTPSPVPTSDTAPPPTPRIAVVGTVVQDALDITITGEAFSTAGVLVNNQLRATVSLDSAGEAQQRVVIADLTDGELLLRAYGIDGAGNESVPSEPLIVRKDTTGPTLAREQVSFILSPASDAGLALAHVSGDYTGVRVAQQGSEREFAPGESIALHIGDSFNVALTDENGNASALQGIAFIPAYASDEQQRYLTPPARFSQLARRMSGSIAAVLAIVLLLAILIRIRVQKPAMITHTAAVIVLAAALFLV